MMIYCAFDFIDLLEGTAGLFVIAKTACIHSALHLIFTFIFRKGRKPMNQAITALTQIIRYVIKIAKELLLPAFVTTAATIRSPA